MESLLGLSPLVPLNPGTDRTHVGPVIAQSAGPFRELCIVADNLEDVRQIVLDRRQVKLLSCGCLVPELNRVGVALVNRNEDNRS